MGSITLTSLGLSPRLTTGLPVTLMVLTTVAVSLRVYVRAYMIRAFGLDDWLILLAIVLFIADSTIDINVGHVLATKGYGPEMITLSKIGVVLYLINQAVIKWSLAIFFSRMIKEVWQWNVMRGMCTVYTVFTTCFIIVSAYRCSNPKVDSVVVGQCLAHDHVLRPLTYLAATLNCVTDWVFAIIPAVVISQIQLTTKARISVYILISLGCISSIASIVRISFIPSSAALGPEYIRKNLIIAMLSLSESGVAITAVCLATLRPLIQASLNRTRGFLNSRDYSAHGKGSTTHGTKSKHERLVKPMGMHNTPLKDATVAVVQVKNSEDIDRGSRGSDQISFMV